MKLTAQFFHEALELIGPIDYYDEAQFQEKGDRYDSLRVVIGDEAIQKLRETSLFMIGCGAIGCELMKIFAMLGIATNPTSLITVTDNDFIEKSNLNRYCSCYTSWPTQKNSFLFD